jgi:hypothetical protein
MTRLFVTNLKHTFAIEKIEIYFPTYYVEAVMMLLFIETDISLSFSDKKLIKSNKKLKILLIMLKYYNC